MNAPEIDQADDVENDEVIGRALRWSLAIAGGVLLVAGSAWAMVAMLSQPIEREQRTEVSRPQVRQLTTAQLPQLPLVDVTTEAGIEWKHVSGMEGERLLPETMGGGVAIFDFDRDGDQDLLLVGGKSWPWANSPIREPKSLCLYENRGDMTFVDVTKEVGLDIELYGMSPVVGDFDNDGWQDLFITTVGKNYLFHNREGKFVDITDSAGVAGSPLAWSTAATWFDYDNDGLLDLLVCDYVVWTRELDLSLGFSLTGIGRAYGQPTAFTGTQCHLFHNEGNGKFSDVSQAAGIEVHNADTGVPVGKALGLITADVNHDGWIDLVVSNDTVQNFLFLNRDGERFEEVGIPMGVAFDRSGNATGAMGIDCTYLRNDDSLAIAIGNFANEQSSLFVSRGKSPPFFDSAMATGLGPMSRLNLTFGLFFADLDLDSRQDIVCANGHLESEINKVQSTQHYAQPPQFFWNAGPQSGSELVPLTAAQVGTEALQPMVGRGAAYGDLDNDGDLDIVLVANSGAPRLLRNDQALGHHWLRLELVGDDKTNRDGYGAIVELKQGDVTQRRIVSATRSYLSQCESIVTFGLGKSDEATELTVHWPGGETQVVSNLELDRLHRIEQSNE